MFKFLKTEKLIMEAVKVGDKFSTYEQWLKWFCEAGGGGSPDKARLEQTPYTHSNPTN